MGELGERLRAAIEPTLEPGEQLLGISLATQQSMFKGRMVGIAVTDHRLILQGVSRKFEPNCEPISLPPERIAEAKAEGAGGGWPQLSAALMDEAAVTLKLKTTDGEKLKLMMMRGSGPLAGLGGGEDQRQGVEALGAWFAEHDSG
jgi:hypothetical protein